MQHPTQYSYKEIWLIAYPILISLLVEQLMGITDTAFLGHLGEVELGASAIAGMFYMAMFMLAFGFSIGTRILMARRNGQREYTAIGRLLYQGIYFQTFLAVVMFLFCYLLSPLILKPMLQSEAVYQAATDYLHWRVFGAFFSFNAVMFHAFFLGTTQTKTITLNSLVMVACNVVFNYILVFGKCGVPAFGIAGAAMGSSLAELVSLTFFVIYTRRNVDLKKYALEHLPRFNASELKELLAVSVWTMIQSFLAIATWFIFFMFVEHLGERALAITNISRSIYSLIFMCASAFGSTCGSLVSNLIGAGRSHCVHGTMRQCIYLAYAVVLPLAALCCIFPIPILSIYTDIPDLQTDTIPSLWVLTVAYFFIVPGHIYFQSVSGTGNTQYAFRLEMITLAVYTVFITYVVYYLKVDVALCWTSEIVYGLMLYLTSYLYMKHGKWQNKQI